MLEAGGIEEEEMGDRKKQIIHLAVHVVGDVLALTMQRRTAICWLCDLECLANPSVV